MPKPMDNFEVKVVSYGEDHLEDAICLCLNKKDKVEAWAINPEKPNQLWLLQWVGSSDKDVHPFPCKMDRKATIEFVKGWLREQDYGREPDHDGSNSKGFTVTNGSTMNIWTMNRILTVEPSWAMHGK